MLRYILGKLALIIPTFIGITILAFGFVRILPGDPVLVLAGERGLSPERHTALMHQFGFDLPIWQQYLTYLTNILSGDFGTSFSTKTPEALSPSVLSLCTGGRGNRVPGFR